MPAPCAIWGARTEDAGRLSSRDADFYLSPRAGGQYVLSRSAKIALEDLKVTQKAYLTSWLMEQRKAGNHAPEITSADVKRATVAKPKSIAERRDGLLAAIAAYTPQLGKPIQYFKLYGFPLDDDPMKRDPNWAVRDYLLAATESVHLDEVNTIIDFAERQRLITKGEWELSLTFEGYSRLEQLDATPTTSVQAFVAMWFDHEVSEAYSQGIAPAISDAGYQAIRIDRKEHNNKIDDEIVSEIRRSKFLVADFTCGMVNNADIKIAIARGGVYYEAGFAQGLGIPVIWCCRADHINHVHFDTRQFNHITWTTPTELHLKLRNRIGAVLGDGPLGSKAS